MSKVNLAEKFALINEHWSPKVVGELNGQQVKLAKLQGEFIWHHHEVEDELFLVIKGEMQIELQDQTITLQEGEFYIVPAGVDHRPGAEQEAEVLMFEPEKTLNTGQVKNERTVTNPEHI